MRSHICALAEAAEASLKRRAFLAEVFAGIPVDTFTREMAIARCRN